MSKLKKISIIGIMFFVICFMLGTKVMAVNVSSTYIKTDYTEEFKKYLQLSPEEQAKVMQPVPYEIPKQQKRQVYMV